MKLKDIRTPADIRGLTAAETDALCAEIRAEILSAVSACGGHLASNLGTVELTVALHRVFDSPRDRIIFDVGHQCYTHKLLSGRRLDTLRQSGGVSGFPRREESEHDTFTTGHSGASLSSALGIAEANRLAHSDAWTVAVIGDGSFTNGMVYEAMNGSATKGLRLVIVLNDNEMSISKNVGALSQYLSRIRVSHGYFAFKRGMKGIFSRIPLLGTPLIRLSIRVKELLKRLFNMKNVFESLGLEYLGPIDGGDVATVEQTLREAMECDAPCVVHVLTKKGRGYAPAEERPDLYHATAPFDAARGVVPSDKMTFSRVAGETLCRLGEADETVCAITAAMRDGTGLTPFAERYPSRFFDVGIAEEHAVTFAAGLARAGMRPFLALYSTFAQRAYDQLQHDVALQHLPLTLLLDRSGIVPGDGATHQGLFDVGIFSPLPGVEIFSPITYAELASLMETPCETLRVIRYPRGSAPDSLPPESAADGICLSEYGTGTRPCVILTYGSAAPAAVDAARTLAAEGRFVRVVRLVRLAPLPTDAVLAALSDASAAVALEEGMRRGGVGEAVLAAMAERGLSLPARILAPEDFILHGDIASLRRTARTDPESLADAVRSVLGTGK